MDSSLAEESGLPDGRLGRRTTGRGFSVNVNLGGRTNRGREVTDSELVAGAFELSDGVLASVTSGRLAALEKGNARREGRIADDVVDVVSATGLARTEAGRRKDDRAAGGVTTDSVPSSVVFSSVTGTGAAVDGRANRGTAELLLTAEDTTELLANPDV